MVLLFHFALYRAFLFPWLLSGERDPGGGGSSYFGDSVPLCQNEGLLVNLFHRSVQKTFS